MIEPGIRPRGRSVTVLASIGCLQVIRRFTRSARSIVTAETSGCDSRMIKGRVRPRGRSVTVLAGIGCLQVIRRFTRSARSIVTTETS